MDSGLLDILKTNMFRNFLEEEFLKKKFQKVFEQKNFKWYLNKCRLKLGKWTPEKWKFLK